MKVFEFFYDGHKYVIIADSYDEAISFFKEELFDDEPERYCEIPESDWDSKFINYCEDNDPEKETLKLSVRESMCENITYLLATTDEDFIN